jgi:hypothetical protein
MEQKGSVLQKQLYDVCGADLLSEPPSDITIPFQGVEVDLF